MQPRIVRGIIKFNGSLFSAKFTDFDPGYIGIIAILEIISFATVRKGIIKFQR
jgi:hypothetical protein